MSEGVRTDEDPYERLDYRRLIAWPSRIAREEPLLRRVLDLAPERSVLDVGCGTGEHALHLARMGARVVGIDRSERQVALARDHEGKAGDGNPRFVLGDVLEVGESELGGPFGVALLLGNVLPHFEDEELERLAGRLTRLLLPGGVLLLQWLNPGRIRAQGIRSLAVNVRDDPKRAGGEVVFLRLLRPDGERHYLFFPTTLALHPDDDPPVQLVQSRAARLRMWEADEVRRALERAGFGDIEVTGGVSGEPFDRDASADVVLLARLAGGRRPSG